MSFARITNSYMNQTILNNTMKNQNKYINLNMQYSTQKKLNTLSDDPISLTSLLNTKNNLTKIEDYKKSITLASGELESADSALDSVNKDLTRIFNLTTQASSELNQSEETGIIANEVQGLLDHIITLANTEYNGKNIFSGANVTTKAYDVTGNDIKYQGTRDSDGYSIKTKISNNSTITLNENGDNIFGEYYDNAGTQVSTGVIGHIKELLVDLKSNPPNYTGIRAKIDVFKKDSENITYYRTQYGAKGKTLDDTKEQLELDKVSDNNLRSNLEDANLIEVASQMQNQEFALQASLQSSSKVIQNSLLNFLS